MNTVVESKSALESLSRSALIAAAIKAGVAPTKAYSTKSVVLRELILASQTPGPVAVASVEVVAEEPEEEANQPAPAIEEIADANVVPFEAEAVQTEIKPEAVTVKPEDSRGIFKVGRKAFQKQLVALSKVVGHSNMQVLNCVLLEFAAGKLRVSGTNLDNYVTTEVPAETAGDVKIAINYAILKAFVSKCASEFMMAEVKGMTLHLSDIVNKTRIMGIKHEEFVPTPDSATAVSILEIQAKQLVKVLGEMLPCASIDETRYILNGVCLDMAKKAANPVVVATDGRRLSRTLLLADKTHAHGRFIIPSKTVEALMQGLPEGATVELLSSSNASRMLARSSSGGFTYGAAFKLVDGNFPNWNQVVPKGDRPSFTIDREEFLAALARVSVLVTEKSNSVKLTFGPEVLRLNTAAVDYGDGAEPVSVKTNHGKEIRVAINPEFLRSILAAWSDDTVIFQVNDELSPLTITAGDKLAVVMPVRLS